MYRHCYHCCANLGTNEDLDAFRVGTSFGFDSAQGRLWVLCASCTRWNLSPLESRWEAIEECERRFRDVRLRSQTANIGYAVLPSGLRLIRVGKPLRPEFAAWRYGAEFGRRRRRAILVGTALTLGGVAIVAGGAYAGIGAALAIGGNLAIHAMREATGPVESVELPRGGYRAWSIDTRETMILPDPETGWRLSLRHHFGRVEYRGDEARRLLAFLFPHVNRAGGSEGRVRDAVREVEMRSGDTLLAHMATVSEALWNTSLIEQKKWDAVQYHHRDDRRPTNRGGLASLTAPRRLALEMAMHEHTEQRAVEGELAILEAAWREAEEIATIADSLTKPPGFDEFKAKHGGAS